MTEKLTKELISPSESSDLEKILNLKYGAFLKDRIFTLYHENKTGEISCSLSLRNPSLTFSYQVEAVVSKVNLPLKEKEALLSHARLYGHLL